MVLRTDSIRGNGPRSHFARFDMQRAIVMISLALAASLFAPLANAQACVRSAIKSGPSGGTVDVEFTNSCGSAAEFVVVATFTDKAGKVSTSDTEPTKLASREKRTMRFGYPQQLAAPINVAIDITEK
jgi:hypothetical protein